MQLRVRVFVDKAARSCVGVDRRLLFTVAALSFLNVHEVRAQMPRKLTLDNAFRMVRDADVDAQATKRHRAGHTNGEGALRNAARIGRRVVAGLAASAA